MAAADFSYSPCAAICARSGEAASIFMKPRRFESFTDGMSFLRSWNELVALIACSRTSGVAKFRRNFEGFLELGTRLYVLSLFLKGQAEVVVGLSVAGLDTDCLRKFGLCGGEISRLQINKPEIVVAFGEVRLAADEF